ncbi:hypothetical protein ONZ45_g14979 [Pleurotus djamor]|nr:hypothetical protein ONZ45_g14979 [Pleurotus djamor]
MWFQVQHNNIYVAHGWTGDALYSAEAALIAILSRPDITSLSTAPDQYFLLITFACTFLIVARFAIYHIREGPVHGQTENLLNRIAERFQQASLSPDHLPSKCAEAIKELVGAWDRRGPRMITRYKEEAIPSSSSSSQPTPQSSSSHSTSSSTSIPLPFSQPGQATLPLPSTALAPSSSFASLTDPELFFDSQFWSSFITNLNS